MAGLISLSVGMIRVLLTIMGGTLISQAVLSDSSLVSLVRVAMNTSLSMTPTISSVTMSMRGVMPRIHINTILIHMHIILIFLAINLVVV